MVVPEVINDSDMVLLAREYFQNRLKIRWNIQVRLRLVS